MLSADDYRLCDHVSHDLMHIRETWSGELSEHVIRRESPIIRRLLVDGDYAKAWRKLGFSKQPIVTGYSLEEMLGNPPNIYIKYAFPTPNERASPAGGSSNSVQMKAPEGRNKGDLLVVLPPYVQQMGAIYFVVPKEVLHGKNPESIIKELGLIIRQPYARPMWLNEFLESSGAYVDGQKISRREILDFVVNAMGGAHYDPNSKKENKSARLLLKPLQVQWRGKHYVHAPWIEVCSIGLCLAWSSDAMRFTSELNSINPPEGFVSSIEGLP